MNAVVLGTPPLTKQEPRLFKNFKQFFSAEPSYVREVANPEDPVIEFLDGLPQNSGNLIIDTKVTMLAPGMFPCIPGWHLDMAPRTQDGKIKWDNIDPFDYRAWTSYLGPAPTKFATGAHQELTQLSLSGYGEASISLETLLNKEGVVKSWSAEEGEIVQFGPTDWHSGQAASHQGGMEWRWFVRVIEWKEHKANRVKNEIRTQTQVYLTSENQGW